MSEMENCYLWKKESLYMGCENASLTVKTPERETKENCQPSPDSSHSPPKPVVEQTSPGGIYHSDVKGMSFSLCFQLSIN